MTMKEKVETFVNLNFKAKEPLLLGFSGGGDSLALVLLFSELNIPVHLAHFDHGWREESRAQASELKRWAKEMGLPYYTERALDTKQTELDARNQRYAFFEKIMKAQPFQALVLAHHHDDQAETVLKRLLEGAHFHNFKAMQPVSKRGGIFIWRPFLAISKSEILDYLRKKGAIPIEDETNFDPKYTRSRMRHQILPYLSKQFGKNVSAPLSRLSDYGKQLSDYLEEKTKDRVLVEDSKGVYYDLKGAHPIEVDFILSKSPFPTPSHHSLKKIHQAIEKNSRNTHISKDWLVDQGLLFWMNSGEILVN